MLLELYHRVWEGGILPQSWKEAVVVPIRKPGKDNTDPGNYRPTALTSNICKIMGCMINERLMYYNESKGYISKCQSGFRRGRNTMDPVLCLEYEVRKAQINKESVVDVFFDIEKAYDTMWREGLLNKIRKMGINGQMFEWIKNFLMGRLIQVRIGIVLSEKFPVENGTPQGSTVSPLLFSLMINYVFNGIKDGMGFSRFADDGAIWKRGENVKFIVKKLQEAIGKVEEWSYKWFKFSVEKTKTMFFTRKKVREDLKLKLYSQELERVNKFKFLGIWFDERITWGVHIQSIMDKSKKVLNIMRCLVGSEWGADRKSMKAIFNGLIRSVLDYGCVAYNSAAKTTLLKLNSIQNQALRLCTGAFKNNPISSFTGRDG
uniref:Reverse transcriptase domain-containing protein n=1 Tax=Nothobranchius furzeri TaxID=105023 RepID=A0A8C6LHB5_NOTFU